MYTSSRVTYSKAECHGDKELTYLRLHIPPLHTNSSGQTRSSSGCRDMGGSSSQDPVLHCDMECRCSTQHNNPLQDAYTWASCLLQNLKSPIKLPEILNDNYEKFQTSILLSKHDFLNHFTMIFTVICCM